MISTILEIVDPHMHMWDLSRHYYAWLQAEPLPNNPAGDVTPIAHRSYLPPDYARDTQGFHVTGTVHVECGLPKEAHLSETDWLETLGAESGMPSGIVAGAWLDHPDVEQTLAAQASRSRVRGIRQIANWHRDPQKTYSGHDRLEDPAWQRGYAQLARYGLSFDMQIYPSQMPSAAQLAARHGNTRMIINHAGMPTDRDAPGLRAWRDGMRMLAAQPNVAVKISGLAMVDRSWTKESLRPFVLETIDLFGTDRCMFASNFPVDSIHGTFTQHYSAYDAITQDFSQPERHALFAGTARRIYRLS